MPLARLWRKEEQNQCFWILAEVVEVEKRGGYVGGRRDSTARRERDGGCELLTSCAAVLAGGVFPHGRDDGG
jgi:hypothetical protein